MIMPFGVYVMRSQVFYRLPERAFVMFDAWCFSTHLSSQALTSHPKPLPLIPNALPAMITDSLFT